MPKKSATPARTYDLCDQHSKLDEEIKQNRLSSRADLSEEKKLKMAIKHLLVKRAKRGDDEAVAYAQKRKWNIGAEVRAAIAAE